MLAMIGGWWLCSRCWLDGVNVEVDEES